MKYTLTYRERLGGEPKTLVIEGDFTLVREDVDVGSVGWDKTGGRNELQSAEAGAQQLMYDDLGITHVHTVGEPKA